MLRNLIVLSIFVGLCAAVPVIWQNDPDGVKALLRSTIEPQTPESEAMPSAGKVGTLALATPAISISGRKVMIDSDDNGHFRSEFKLNGRRVEAMVDTGATAVALNLSTARRAGISVSTSDMTRTVSTANGDVRATTVMLDRVEIGRIVVEDVPALVLEDRALSSTLVGMSFLKRLKSYSVQDGKMQLVQ